MPVYIRKAHVQKEHLALPILKDWRKHYFITASWADMRAMIKAWMIINDRKHLQVTSDREIKEVFVGNKSRTDGETEYLTARYNSIEDLVDPADLLVIKLNELGYKNKAAAGALEEAINYRLDRDKITWAFNDVRRPFGNNSICYSDSLSDVIAAGFRSVVIHTITKETDMESTLMANAMPLVNKAQPVRTVEPKEAVVKPVKSNAKSSILASIDEPEDLLPEPSVEPDLASIYGSGLKKKKSR